MRLKRVLHISSIKMDYWPINHDTLKLVDHLRGGGQVPPIKVAADGLGTFIIKDGRHRVTAFKLLGLERIEAKYGWPNNDPRDDGSEENHVENQEETSVPSEACASPNQGSLFEEGESGW